MKFYNYYQKFLIKLASFLDNTLEKVEREQSRIYRKLYKPIYKPLSSLILIQISINNKEQIINPVPVSMLSGPGIMIEMPICQPGQIIALKLKNPTDKKITLRGMYKCSSGYIIPISGYIDANYEDTIYTRINQAVKIQQIYITEVE